MVDIELVIKIPEEIQLALINNIQLSMDQQSICDSYIKHAIINGKPLPQSATNGDMIKFMFPDAQIDYHEKSEFVEEYITVYPKDCDTCQDYPKYWWNLPYKEEGAE